MNAKGRGGTLSGSMRLALFALLVMAEGYRCSEDQIIEALWPEKREGGRRRVHRLVSDLRDVFGKGAVINEGRGTYVLIVKSMSLDVLRFRTGVREARGLQGRKRFDRLVEALNEWPAGAEALHGLVGRPFALLRENLINERMHALHDLLETAWQIREIEWLRAETQKWIREAQDDPTIFRFYLKARSGDKSSRQELKTMMRKWRKNNGDPDEELRRAMDTVLGRVSAVRRSFEPVPDQLPREGRTPRGQDDLLEEVESLVKARLASGRGASIAVSGMPGVGKSTVLLNLAWRLRSKFPDGVLYFNMRGFSGADVRPATTEEVLDSFLAALPPFMSNGSCEAKSGAFRSLVAQRAMLIVLDDVRNAEQILPLLPGTGLSTVLVASRQKLAGLQSLQEVEFRTVEPPEEAAALEILWQYVPVSDRRGHEQAFVNLVRFCERLPLALVILAWRLRNLPVRAVSRLAQEMEDECSRLDHLEHPSERSVMTVLQCSARLLSPAARLLLRRLSVHPGPTVRWEAVMHLNSGESEMNSSRALEELIEANLVECQSKRFRLHDLVRSFSRHRMELDLSDSVIDFEKKTVLNILEYQLHCIRSCDKVLNPRRVLPIGEPEGFGVYVPESRGEAMSCLDEEYPAALPCIELAHEWKSERHMWMLPMALVAYQWQRNRLSDAMKWLRMAVDTAETFASAPDLAMVHRMIAGTQWRSKQFNLAESTLRRSIALSKDDESAAGRLSLAHSLQAYGVALRKKNQQVEHTVGNEAVDGGSLGCFQWALSLFRELSDRAGEAAALNGLGTLHHDRGEYDDALRICAEALRVVESTSDRAGYANTLCTLAKIHVSRAEREEAFDLYRKSAAVYQGIDDWAGEDDVLCRFADALVMDGRIAEAEAALERVLALRERMGTADVEQVRSRLEGLR
ncbi:AfsR/SARP family transcriptional regulator [Streptomyces liangshanensis]|uniref:Tetratricopeptide repeat protein n=1 Tax=Streptomyces liangshanensis TaxID=2717324 RepID=A0A6G9H489_9ACTN|nr:tetratricopeptide repeat protein [Streptomyces liangshanensis]QIQ05116.1 tetratricopeptide repeat protein [Streptomyces liangshanensis]